MTAEELVKHRTARRAYNMREGRIRLRRNYQSTKLYDLSADEYQILWKSQKGLCAICGEPEHLLTKTGRPRFLCIDHDHETGKVRGLLCNSCNIAISKIPRLMKYWSQINHYLGGEIAISSSDGVNDEPDEDDEG